MQVNNIKIKYNREYHKWECISPNGSCLEMFLYREDAINWAKETEDFVVRRKRNKKKLIEVELEGIVRTETQLDLEENPGHWLGNLVCNKNGFWLCIEGEFYLIQRVTVKED